MSDPWPPNVRRLLLVAAVVVTLEALGVIAFAVADLASIDGGRVAVGVGVAVFFLFYGGTQLVAVVLLLRGRYGARGPIVATQLLQLLIAWSLRDVDGDALAIRHLPLGAGLAALVVLVCVLAPPVNRAIAARESTEGA